MTMDERDELSWVVEGRETVGDHAVFTVERIAARHPVTGSLRDFSVINCPDWVNVLALTRADDVVLVRQYRHGTQAVSLEIPGGVIDAGESPVVAARRELAEETGYGGGLAVDLGWVDANPAIQNNRCHTVMLLDVDRLGAPAPDEDELLATELRPLTAMGDLLARGAISHAMVFAAFAQLVARAGGFQRPAP